MEYIYIPPQGGGKYKKWGYYDVIQYAVQKVYIFYIYKYVYLYLYPHFLYFPPSPQGGILNIYIYIFPPPPGGEGNKKNVGL